VTVAGLVGACVVCSVPPSKSAGNGCAFPVLGAHRRNLSFVQLLTSSRSA
jgi:hypothetical protein